MGLRDNGEARKMWGSIEDQQEERRTHMGPYKMARDYLLTLQIETQERGMTWRWEDTYTHVLRTPKEAFRHMLRETIRAWLARKATTCRPHLHGLMDMNLEASRSLTKEKGFPQRQALIALMADGVWTNRKKFLCGFRPDETCSYCQAPSETVRHILYECPRWQAHWKDLRGEIDMISSLPPAASQCGLRPKNPPSRLKDRWKEVQACMAMIIHERMEEEHKGREKRIEVPEQNRAPKRHVPQDPPPGRSHPWDFHFTERLHGGVRPGVIVGELGTLSNSGPLKCGFSPFRMTLRRPPFLKPCLATLA